MLLQNPEAKNTGDMTLESEESMSQGPETNFFNADGHSPTPKEDEESKEIQEQEIKNGKNSPKQKNISMIFQKHRVMKIFAHKDFDFKKESLLDSFQFSWEIHGQAAFSKFIPTSTKHVSNQMNIAFEMTA